MKLIRLLYHVSFPCSGWPINPTTLLQCQIKRVFSVVIPAVFLAISSVQADVRLPSLIRDRMVLQRDQVNPIWGWAEPGEAVTVTLGVQKKTATAGQDGYWSVKLDPLPAGGPHEITIAGKNTFALKDILVGEVWFCAGQSNMGLRVLRCRDGTNEMAKADYPQIRLFTVERAFTNAPQKDCKGEWKICTPDSARDFSGIGYFFGRDLHQKLKVPVGLIHSSWLGTPAESWSSKEGMDADPELGPAVASRWQKYVDGYPEAKKKYDEALVKWEENAQKAKDTNQPAPKKLDQPRDPAATEQAPSSLYNAMVAPVIPYGIRGVLWYQGEGNIDRGYWYRKLFPLLIQDWRKRWDRGDFPFLFVQIGGWRDIPTEPKESSFSDLRESQLVTWKSVTNTAMAVSLDICEGVVHFANKQEPARRLALAAMAMVYGGKDVLYSGPIYKDMTVEGNQVKIQFDHVGTGLVTTDGQPVKFLAIAGEDKKFVWANSKIENNTLVVWKEGIAKPAAVRYGWGEWPKDVNLGNKEGFPASPFRTDDWLLPTTNAK